MTGSLQNVGPGDALELPGSSVSTADFDTVDGILTVATDLGTTTFSNVAYQPDLVVTGFTGSADPATGLEKVTLDGYETRLLQTVAYSVTYNGSHFDLFAWSNDNNWDNGVAADGGHVTINVTGGASPQSYDDIADLSLATVDSSPAALRSAGSSMATSVRPWTLPASVSVPPPPASSATRKSALPRRPWRSMASPATTSAPSVPSVPTRSPRSPLPPTPANTTRWTRAANCCWTRRNSSPGTTGEVFTFENTGTASGIFAFENPGETINAPLTGVGR